MRGLLHQQDDDLLAQNLSSTGYCTLSFKDNDTTTTTTTTKKKMKMNYLTPRGKPIPRSLQPIPEIAFYDAAKSSKGWFVSRKKKYLIAEYMNKETPPDPMFSA